jgi:hypothetical protein
LEPQILLAALKSHLAQKPDFDSYTVDSLAYREWLGKAAALVNQWNTHHAAAFRSKVGFLQFAGFKKSSLGDIFGTLFEAISDLELKTPSNSDKIFGPGALYDFFTSFRELIMSARESLLIVDPYLNADVFDSYVVASAPTISIRLLAGTQQQYFSPLVAAVKAYNASYKTTIEVRRSSGLHDRVLVIDAGPVWVMGQSIKDAAKKSPTYLALLDPHVAHLKREHYEQIWAEASEA